MRHAMFLALMMAPTTALADAHGDAVASAASNLNTFAGYLRPGDSLPGWVLTNERYAPAACTKAMAEAKKAGVVPGDVLIGTYKYHPKAKKQQSSEKYEITFADAEWICTAYANLFKLEHAAAPIRAAASHAAERKGPPTAEQARGYNVGAGKASVDQGKECLKAIDQVIKDGVPATTKIKLTKGETTLEDAKPLCQQLIDDGLKFEEFIAIEYKAKQAERSKKYEEAGIKGAKLALMVEYDSVYWRGKGCEKIDDVAVLAKSNKLYQWLENANGTHTIRTYLFAGNAVKGKSDKTYQTEAAAYAGCR